MSSIYHSHIMPALVRPHLPNLAARIHDFKRTRKKLQAALAATPRRPPPIITQQVVMCEQIIKYDCGHLSRKKIPCTKQKKQNRQSTSSLSCFSSYSSEDECAQREKRLEHRATLCRACQAANKDQDVYQNSQRESRATQHKGDNAVSTSKRSERPSGRRTSSSSRQGQVSQTPPGNAWHHHERRNMPPTRHGFESPIRRTHAPRPQNIVISHPTFAEQGLPTPGTAHGRTSHLSPRREQHSRNPSSQSNLSRTDSTIERLSRDILAGFQIQPKPSDESLVCLTARNIERK
ncbi:hypothetical protein PT974_11425 [Cladobotryum mycophilum]|uniref:Uncharacterized protein n=1 Tax=Cladobotryum mycophilum TaxID=491253 RepID=A0ABR0S685_9HYPO